MAPADEAKVVDEVVDRLVGKFPRASRQAVRHRVAEVLHEFDGSRVRDFVPVLVEREVADELRVPQPA